MENKGVVTSGGKYVQLDNGEVFPISRYQKNHGLNDGQETIVKIGTEYPESCDNNPFCEGDETCIVCLCNNKVAILRT